jgi:flagellar motor switch protein FliG
VRERAEELADNLARLMVSFEDLERLDKRAIQALLRVVERPDLVLALKGAHRSLRDAFLVNLSQRAAADLGEEIELGGTPRRSQVKEAQERIVAAARKLAEEGVIYLDLGAPEEG